jgi:hypothetical protein
VASETSQTLDRGLRVLEALADAPEGLTVTELAAQLDIGRTVVYRLVVTLEQHALLRRSADGRCRLGLGILALGRRVQPVVRVTSLPALRPIYDLLHVDAQHAAWCGERVGAGGGELKTLALMLHDGRAERRLRSAATGLTRVDTCAPG